MSSDNKNVPIDYNVKEIIDNLDKKKILTPEDKKRIEESLNFEAAIEKIEEEFSGNGRVLIRPSGTEPLVRVMIEGENQEILDQRAHELAKLIEERLK